MIKFIHTKQEPQKIVASDLVCGRAYRVLDGNFGAGRIVFGCTHLTSRTPHGGDRVLVAVDMEGGMWFDTNQQTFQEVDLEVHVKGPA